MGLETHLQMKGSVEFVRFFKRFPIFSCFLLIDSFSLVRNIILCEAAPTARVISTEAGKVEISIDFAMFDEAYRGASRWCQHSTNISMRTTVRPVI